jgi:predicted negative regulator of RcsB-dependent stress response
MKEPIFFIVMIGLIAFVVALGMKTFVSKTVDTAPATALNFEDRQLFISQQRTRQDRLKRDHDDFRRQYEQQMRDFKQR